MPDVTITVSEDGPYIVEGDVSLIDPDGRELCLPMTASSAVAGNPETSRSAMAPTPRSISMERSRTDLGCAAAATGTRIRRLPR